MKLPNVIKGIKVIFGLCLVYFALLLVHYHYYLISDPYPIMYREGSMMATTSMLVHGFRPFNLFWEPQYLNVYGIIYPLIAVPFVKLLGESLIVYRAITAFFILASCLIIFLVLKKNKASILLSFWAILTLYASLLYPLTSTPCIDPASTGLFFMLLTIFIPFLLDYSYPSLFLSILFGLLSFYTKPYFLMGIPVIVSYVFIFISKKRSFVFGLSFLFFLIISVFIMNIFFTTYFDDCFFVHFNWIFYDTNLSVLEMQTFKFLSLNLGLIVLNLILVVYALWRLSVKIRGNNAQAFIRMGRGSLHWKDWEAPLINKFFYLDIYAGIISLFLLITIMGQKPGANMWYFFQLLTPFGVIVTANLIGRFYWWPIVFSALLVYNLFSLCSDDNYKYFGKDALGMIGWQEIETLVKSRRYIFNTPLIAPLLIKEDREVFDNGHTEYYNGGRLRFGLFKCFFSNDKRVLHSFRVFIYKLNKFMENKKFDLLIIEAGYNSKLLPYSSMSNYKYIDSILVNAPQDRKPFLLTIWSPN